MITKRLVPYFKQVQQLYFIVRISDGKFLSLSGEGWTTNDKQAYCGTKQQYQNMIAIIHKRDGAHVKVGVQRKPMNEREQELFDRRKKAGVIK